MKNILLIVLLFAPFAGFSQSKHKLENPVKQYFSILTYIGSNPVGEQLTHRWFLYRATGSFAGKLELAAQTSEEISFTMPEMKKGQELLVIL